LRVCNPFGLVFAKLVHLLCPIGSPCFRVSRNFRTIRLRRLEGQLGELAYQITKVHFARFRRPDQTWSPAINVFLCENCLRISVELAGVDPGTLNLDLSPGLLRISGHRDAPEPPASAAAAPGRLARREMRVITMEINYGAFEREIQLPPDLVIGRAASEWFNGLLWISIPRRSQA
jgi:HSP20 family molecular chaperone IbpA